MNAAPTNPTNVTEASHGPRIFISYRRSDRALAAQWVHREVAGRFGHEAVFFDVDGIPPGFDYRDFLQQRVSECDVLLAIIGDDWLDVRDADGRRRLENKNDFVRIEIDAALRLTASQRNCTDGFDARVHYAAVPAGRASRERGVLFSRCVTFTPHASRRKRLIRISLNASFTPAVSSGNRLNDDPAIA